MPATTLYVHNNGTAPGAPTTARVSPIGSLRQIRFAHPAEADIARLLDYYDVRWQYEPTTFALITGDRGQPIQSFTPDFYLPDDDVYIEMTTMRQSLVTRKNRKFRLLRELYPQLNVRILYRKDVELILDRYVGALEDTRVDIDPKRLIREDQVQRRVAEIAETLLEWVSRPICLLALGQGAVRTQELIASWLHAAGLCVTEGLLSVDGYGPDRRTCAVRLECDPDQDLRNLDVVVVADIVGTGLTAHTALRWLSGQGAERVRLISLLDRRSARLVDVPLEVAGFPATSTWLVGAGLGQCARFRELPDIHTVDPRPVA